MTLILVDGTASNTQASALARTAAQKRPTLAQTSPPELDWRHPGLVLHKHSPVVGQEGSRQA